MKDYRVTFMKKGEARLVEHEWEERELGDDEIFGQNILSLISTGSERGGYQSDYPASAYPMGTGSSSVARAIAVGKNVTGIKPGDLYFNVENHNLYVRAKAEDAIALPEGADPRHAVFGRYAAVSMTSIYRSGIKPVEKVLVTGLGLVGIMCAQTLRAFGFEVYAIDLSQERQAIAREVGIPHVGASFAEFADLDHAAGALMECSGDERALMGALGSLRKLGEIFQIAVPWRKNADVDAHTLLRELFYGFLSVHGGWEWSLPRRPGDLAPHSNYGHIRDAMRMIAQGKMRVLPGMYELRDPRDCAQVYEDIAQPRQYPTCIMFDWAGSKL